MGDVHFYDYGMMCTNVSQMPDPRFASEYGFQSFPSVLSWLPGIYMHSRGVTASNGTI